MTADDVREILHEAPGVVVQDDPSVEPLPDAARRRRQGRRLRRPHPRGHVQPQRHRHVDLHATTSAKARR